MSLTCACDYDPEPGDICWVAPRDYSVLATKRARKCCSCGDKITPGETVAAFHRYKVPEYQIEIDIYGDDGFEGPPRATWYHCERCADLFFSLIDLGFCIHIKDEMRALVREYAATYGSTA